MLTPLIMKPAITSPHRRGNLRILIARAALLVPMICCSLAWSTEPQKSKANQRDHQPKTEQRGTEISPLFVKGEVTAKKDKAEAESDAKEREEKAHLDSALVKYTLWLAVGSFALFGAAAIQAALFVWQLRLIGRSEAQAKQVAEAAKGSADAALLSLRPWLSCKIELGEPLTFNADGDAVFAFHFIVKNVGHSPAMAVQFLPNIGLFEFHNDSMAWLKKMADWNRDMGVDAPTVLIPGELSMGREQYGPIIFPGGRKTFNYRIPLKRSNLEKSCADIRPNTNFFPEVFAIVFYTYPSATIRASTAACRMILKIGGAFELDKFVGLDEMRLEDFASGDFAT